MSVKKGKKHTSEPLIEGEDKKPRSLKATAIGWHKKLDGTFEAVEFKYDPENPTDVELVAAHNTGGVRGAAMIKFERIGLAKKIIL